MRVCHVLLPCGAIGGLLVAGFSHRHSRAEAFAREWVPARGSPVPDAAGTVQ